VLDDYIGKWQRSVCLFYAGDEYRVELLAVRGPSPSTARRPTGPATTKAAGMEVASVLAADDVLRPNKQPASAAASLQIYAGPAALDASPLSS